MMKKLFAIAAFLLASTAAQAQYSFEYGGRTIRIDPDRGTVSIPGVYDNSGLMLHPDNESIVRERIYLNKADPNVLQDEITVTDHALTRPWAVKKTYKREQPDWREDVCAEGNAHVRIGKENYMLSADGYLMPAKKGQVPPDLKYFRQSQQ